MNSEKKAKLIKAAEEQYRKVAVLQELGLICDDGDFVPSVHYPPITEYPNNGEEECLKGYEYPSDGMMDIYVHIPFCIQHCVFCHYPGKAGECTDEKYKYIDYLIREIDLYRSRFGIDRIKPRSILIGGGTPTYLPPDLLEHFLEEFGKRIDLSRCKQYNVDLDPNTMLGEDGKKRCESMKKHGVTRLTIGIQSLDPKVLKLMNRAHTAEMAREAAQRGVDFGFDVNIEFIYGFPGENLDNWIEIMEQAVTFPVNEIQIYRLKVRSYGDKQGIINRYARGDGDTDIPNFKETMMMKQLAIDILAEHGYHETIRRVYSKDKRIFSHYAYNQCCNLYDQVGFGLTGFSSYRDRFDINSQYFDEYYSLIDSGKLPITRGYIRPQEEQIRQAIVLPLKNRDIRKKDFLKKTGVDFDTIFKTKKKLLIEHGLLEDTGKVVRLTELGGFVADEVCECFNSDRYKPFPRERYAEGPLNPYLYNNLTD